MGEIHSQPSPPGPTLASSPARFEQGSRGTWSTFSCRALISIQLPSTHFSPHLLTANDDNCPRMSGAENRESRCGAMVSTTNDNCPQLSSPNQRVGGSIPSRRTISAGHRPAGWRSSFTEGRRAHMPNTGSWPSARTSSRSASVVDGLDPRNPQQARVLCGSTYGEVKVKVLTLAGPFAN